MNVTDPTQVTHKIDPNQHAELRSVYLAIYNSAITTDIPEVAVQTGLKPRYVKELIGILETHADSNGDAFVVVNAEPGEAGNDSPHVWYQTSNTVDQHSTEQAEDWFDRHFPKIELPDPSKTQTKASTPRSPRNATNPADLPVCLCGCKGICNRGRNYKPGHDARHAGQVARQMAATSDPEARDRLKDALPTDALKWKAATMADRLLAKGSAPEDRSPAKPKAAPVEKVVDVDGTVKVGRYELRAVQNSKSGAVVYFTKDDKANVASDRIAKTFKVKGA